jgi:hypothetical protein
MNSIIQEQTLIVYKFLEKREEEDWYRQKEPN